MGIYLFNHYSQGYILNILSYQWDGIYYKHTTTVPYFPPNFIIYINKLITISNNIF